MYLSGSDYANEQDEQECKKLEQAKGIKIKVLTISDLKATFGVNPVRTGNALFDEFWFDYYSYKKTTPNLAYAGEEQESQQ